MSLWFLLYIHMITDDFKNGSIIFFFQECFGFWLRWHIGHYYYYYYFLIIHFSSFFFYFKHFYWFILSNCFSNSCDVYSNIWSANIYTYIRACVRACVCDVCVCVVLSCDIGQRRPKKKKEKQKSKRHGTSVIWWWIGFGLVAFAI